MADFEIKGYDSYSGCDIVVTARLATLNNSTKKLEEKIYTLGSLQTLSVSTHQDKKPVRVIGSMNALDYTMGQRTIAGSLVFAVFDKHFATEMFNDLEKATGKTFFLPDELPAMDITITFANEYGRTSRMAIYGLRIINEGQVMSINDLYTENTYQFVATAMEPLKKYNGGGSSSNKRNEAQVASVFELNDIPAAYSGEEIWTKGCINENENLKRVLLTAEVDQPIYEGQEGIVKFSLSPNQSSGIVYIYHQIQNKLYSEIHVDGKALYTTYLDSGLYSAWYEDKGQTLSNTATFSIDNLGEYNSVYDDAPNIEDITDSSIKIICNNPTHTIGVCINSLDNSSIELELTNRNCTFKNLTNNTNYVIYTRDDNNSSRTVSIKTLALEESFISGFKNYVRFNSYLLSTDLDQYEEILNEIKESDDLIYSLERNQDIKAKELMYMAVKYKNEFTTAINSHKIESMPKKNLANIYGNSFSFDTGVTKANIFLVKNKKEYYEYSEQYPNEITYMGKSNRSYNVVAITNDFVKSPKYLFYSFSDNDKSRIDTLYGDANILEGIDLTTYMDPVKKYPDSALKCLAVKDNKNIDIRLLKAPTVTLDEELNITVDVKYNDLIGAKDNEYYLVISNIKQSLDKTPFRKIKITDRDEIIFANKYLTAINSKDTYALWIEDQNFNIVSEVAFISENEEIVNFNTTELEDIIQKIISKVEFNLGKINLMTDVYSSVLSKETSIKNIHYDMIQSIVDLKLDNTSAILEILKMKFNDLYINQDKYRTVTYDGAKVKFDNFNNAQIIHIGFKRDSDYIIEVIDEDTMIIDNNYLYNLYYVIDNNPVIKSGFILIANEKATSHLIRLEEI